MLNILGTAMVATSYRYIAVELGKGEKGNPNKQYNTILVIHIAAALFLIIVGEIIGSFYIKNYLNVDSGRIPDALFVLRLSLLTTSFVVISIPTNGLIIAREKFVFTSIIETVSILLKLALVISLIYIDGNRLRYYAIFLAIVQLLIPLSYQIYCLKLESNIVRWNFNKNYEDYKEVFSFAWWILLGAVAEIGKVQGAAVIINYFYGTVLNAAFGLATQVNNAVSMFTSTLRQATVPQIMKSQGAGDERRSLDLVYATSRYSFLCMSIIAIPLLLCLDELLVLWLGTPPEFTNIYIFFMILNGLIGNLRAGFDASIQASGNIKKNQIGFSIINLMLLPIILLLYKMGNPPYVNVIVMMFLTMASVIFQIYIMRSISKC